MLKGKYFLFVSFSDNDIFLWKFMRVINSIRLNLTFQHPWYLFIYSVKWLSYQVHNIIYQQVYLYLTYEMRHSSKYKNNISSYHLDYTYTCSIDKVRGGGVGWWSLFTYSLICFRNNNNTFLCKTCILILKLLKNIFFLLFSSVFIQIPMKIIISLEVNLYFLCVFFSS